MIISQPIIKKIVLYFFTCVSTTDIVQSNDPWQ